VEEVAELGPVPVCFKDLSQALERCVQDGHADSHHQESSSLLEPSHRKAAIKVSFTSSLCEGFKVKPTDFFGKHLPQILDCSVRDASYCATEQGDLQELKPWETLIVLKEDVTKKRVKKLIKQIVREHIEKNVRGAQGISLGNPNPKWVWWTDGKTEEVEEMEDELAAKMTAASSFASMNAVAAEEGQEENMKQEEDQHQVGEEEDDGRAFASSASSSSSSPSSPSYSLSSSHEPTNIYMERYGMKVVVRNTFIDFPCVPSLQSLQGLQRAKSDGTAVRAN